MKPRYLAIVLLGLVPSLHAEQPFPSAVKPTINVSPGKLTTASLPEGVRKALAAEEVFVEDGKTPGQLWGKVIDLNGDGAPEYLVNDPASYTGGPMTYILTPRRLPLKAKGDSSYRLIGVIQGIDHLAARKNGFYQIVATARAGGATYERRLFAYRLTEYVATRAAEYEFRGDDEIYVKEVAP